MSLKHLTKKLLHQDIQIRESRHSPVEDAQATMELYKLVEVEWEQYLAQNTLKNKQLWGDKGSTQEKQGS
ncbi:Hypothetical predicted protein [Marmota monax]|uniref:Exonuclease domain-containing protein n=1 Tax=Marmota monax TaxID=9995 RepID=A0A5E4CN82_MARMO|nr:Hypothetical predicted protein [Marmota monax]